MAKQFDAAPGADKLAIVKSTVGGLGGSIGVRVIIDDTLITSKTAAKLAVEAIRQRIGEDTWPIG
jgi:hypothetical protein